MKLHNGYAFFSIFLIIIATAHKTYAANNLIKPSDLKPNRFLPRICVPIDHNEGPTIQQQNDWSLQKELNSKRFSLSDPIDIATTICHGQQAVVSPCENGEVNISQRAVYLFAKKASRHKKKLAQHTKQQAKITKAIALQKNEISDIATKL